MTAAETETASPQTPAIRQALSVVELGLKATKAYGRADLGDRLAHTRERLLDPAFHVLVVGEFKQGKSSLVNALLNAPVCPVDDDIATARPTLIRHAEEPKAALLVADRHGADDERRPPRRQDVPMDEVRRHVTESVSSGTDDIVSVEIAIPRRMLADGLVLVDTPGVGGLGSTHSTPTIGALPMADAVIFVSDASQEYTAPELEFMDTALSMCPNLYCVLTKVDFYPTWRKILELDRAHLARRGISADIQPVSSMLRQHAVSSNDQALNDESGFPGLVAYLEGVVADAERLTIRTAASDVVAVAEQLEAQFQSERAVLDDPDGAAETTQRLEEAKARAEALRSRAAKWQQTLGDGIADLSADVDHDLRQRFRVISRDADEAIEEGDPAQTWAEFEPWLYRRVAEDVTHNYAFLQQRVAALSERVAEHFELDRGQVGMLAIHNPTDVIRSTEVEAELEVTTMKGREKGWTALRGGYISVLMFTMLGQMVGLALGPLAVVPGLLMGRKALRDEKERQLNQRRQQAKNAYRKYTDEVAFLVGKDSRDTLRQTQRTLRDFYSSQADELLASTSENLAAARQAAQTDAATRQGRLKDVNAEITRIRRLLDRAQALMADRPEQQPPARAS